MLAACGGSDAAELPGNGAADRSAPSQTSSEPLAAAAPVEDSVRTVVKSSTDLSSPAISDPRATVANTTPPTGAAANGSLPDNPSPADPTADAVLRAAELAYADVRSMAADFVQDLTVPLLGTTQRSHGKIYHRRPDRFLMQFAEPAGDIVLADGEFLWMYYPSSDPKQVIRTPLTGGTVQKVDFQQQFLSNAVERFDAHLVGKETVNGRTMNVLVLTPTGETEFQRVKLWIDATDSLVRRFEITEQNGTVRKVQLSNLRPNVALSDDLFEFTPPPGTQVFTQ